MSDKCRSCGAAIKWAVNERTNKRMPVDAFASSVGNVLIENRTDPFGAPYCTVFGNKEILEKMRADGADFHTSHFATCPNAAQHRKGGAS